jgi:hypothetical protein
MKETRRERRGPLAALLLVVCCLLGTAWSCARKGGAFGPSGEGSAAVGAVARPEPTQAPGAVVAGRRAVPGLALFEDHTVGAPFVSGNLAVFPVYASVQEDVGEIVTLDEALQKGTAEVREVGPEAVAGEQVREVQQRAGEGAVVNTLVIENRGKQPILVLAGTILKGGKQDRQVGRDFLVGANETEPVDAFCIEHNRWTTVRDGLATGGKFRAMKVLAVGEVRGAGQYEGDQGKVWAKVSAVNQANGKESASGTLLATVDAADLVAEREAVAKEILAFFRASPQPADIVGMAYAVDGEVRGLRTFMSHGIFRKFEETLAGTAALEAITARRAAKARGESPQNGALGPAAVVAFVSDLDKGESEAARDSQAFRGESKKGESGYASTVQMKSAPAAAGPPAKQKAVTRDYLKKK